MRRHIVSLALASSVVVMAAAFSKAPAPALTLMLGSIPHVKSIDWCGRCVQAGCPPAYHQFFEEEVADTLPSPDRAMHEGTHPCWEGWCSQTHEQSPFCDTSAPHYLTPEEFTAELTRLYAATSVEAIKAGLLRLRGRAHYNAERHAVQVLECSSPASTGEELIASIPLRVGLREGLEAWHEEAKGR